MKLDLHEIKVWREKQDQNLRKEEGWLSLVGLFWLNPGENKLGSDQSCNVRLPDRCPRHFGTIEISSGQISCSLGDVSGVFVDGSSKSPKSTFALNTDGSGIPTKVSWSGITFFLLKRGERIAVRVCDSQSPLRSNFKGRKWFEPDEKWVLKGFWKDLAEPVELEIADVTGGEKKEKVNGYVEFTFGERIFSLYPIVESSRLFLIFKDLTNGTKTYGAGRFLWAEKPLNGLVILDFNKAVSPPCAFTDFATCPLPPAQNRLPIEVLAGEKYPFDK